MSTGQAVAVVRAGRAITRSSGTACTEAMRGGWITVEVELARWVKHPTAACADLSGLESVRGNRLARADRRCQLGGIAGPIIRI